MQAKHQTILLFLRAPEIGTVKTRLGKTIGAPAALELYKNFILDIMDTLRGMNVPLRICFCPEDRKHLLTALLGSKWDYYPQKGDDLGQRMAGAFRWAFSDGYGSAIGIGSDLPDLPAHVIEEALRSLSESDAVLGPADDGGYYLIGFREDTYNDTVFTGIPWGTESVFSMTLDRLRRLNYRVHILPEWTDIDCLEGLQKFLIKHQDRNDGAKRTLEYVTVIQTELLKNGD